MTNTVILPDFVKVNVLSSHVVDNKLCKSYNRNYFCKIKNTKTNKSFNVTFHDSVYNWKHNVKLNKTDVIYSVLSDARAYEDNQEVRDFIVEFGYDTITDSKKGKRIYNACKKTSERVHDVFNDDELKTLDDLLQDY